MKFSLLLLVAAITLSTFTACDSRPKTTGKKVEDKIKDGLDARPGEKVRDAAEDTKEAIKDATK